MTPELAIQLATAIDLRDNAARGLKALIKTASDHIEVPAPLAASISGLASTYVHEQRIINRIIHEDTDQ